MVEEGWLAAATVDGGQMCSPFISEREHETRSGFTGSHWLLEGKLTPAFPQA